MEPIQISSTIGISMTSTATALKEMCDDGILDRRKNGLTFIYFIPKKGSN